jgi:hypothetical protein
MNTPFIKATVLCTAFLCSAINCSSQSLQADTNLKQTVLENTVLSFYNAIGEQSRLYNGPEYSFYDPTIKGNAYFSDAVNFANGTVEYDGFIYNDVPMMYDIYKDVVAVLLPNKSAKFKLLSDRVQYFDLLGHRFVYVEDTTEGKHLNAGFYNQLYKSKTEVLVKYSKSIQGTSGISGTVENYFTSKKEMFVKNRGRYFNAGSQGSLLDAFKDKKKELKQYIRDNNLKFGNDQEQSAVKLAAYYDQLTL